VHEFAGQASRLIQIFESTPDILGSIFHGGHPSARPPD
jgi:hypothetical protein